MGEYSQRVGIVVRVWEWNCETNPGWFNTQRFI